MAQKIGTAEWYEIANKMDGCICPTCQTGKENLATYPDYCPHAQHLKVTESSGDPMLGVRTIGKGNFYSRRVPVVCWGKTTSKIFYFAGY